MSPTSPTPTPTIRPAHPPDLPSLTHLIPTAMSADPLYNYRYPHRHLHPTDHSTHTTAEYGSYIASPDYTVMLATLPDPSSLDNAKTVVVGMAIWYHPTPTTTPSAAGSDDTGSNRQDTDVVHDEQFTTAMSNAKTHYFDNVYGSQGHLHLQLLCTHPGFVRRGVGRALVGWGIGMARGEGQGKGVGVVSLMASQTGEKLYEGLGFRRLGWVAVGEGEDGGKGGLGLGLEAMVLDLREGGGGSGEVTGGEGG
ncbi:MAG: hypothetical protein OHK93_005782 [Ramalina farinacea]|uniref:N-acetyltransferase domain-containing protein n=1 Tax=Ramalina farinacea TaxID=258253 RepID=A0AA43QKF2_9LECA|nr:hypothetical protein [Ramalina farinacea]